MSSAALSAFVALAAFSASFGGVRAQEVTGTYPATALASKTFAWPTGVPYQADTDTGLIRGAQYGYNICNSTTEGQSSKCQTGFMNSLDDFCLWGPHDPNSAVGDHEGNMVAWCTKPGHGTRLIPEGTLTGVQFIKTPDYVSFVGFIDQTKINIAFGDWGGEMDPHGADLRGNPLGGLLYSNLWGSGGEDYDQVIEWHNFIGGNFFCFKACDPAGPNAAHYCEHVFDRMGCAYNVPNAAVDGVFVSCEGENQDFPGTYTVSGQVMTYTQPAESLGAISTYPYTARVPASSNCVTHTSAAVYTGLVGVSADAAVSTPATAVSVTGTSSGVKTSATGKASGSGSGSATSTGTGSASAASTTGNSAAGQVVMSGAVSLVGVVFAALFLS